MILPKMLSFIEKYHMLDGCKTLILGVSGGADSVCLLLLMEKICAERGIVPVVVHIEHGIRGKESLEDAAFVENLCKEKGILFHLYSYDVKRIARESGESTEEAGRRLRYATFAEMAEQYEAAKIAVAHNENDNAETVLFHLARGSGLKGMSGIPPVRGNIIRPLLSVSRCEIEEYLRKENQPYRTDKTNFSDIYARNRIRHEVLPVLESVNAKAVVHIGQTAGEMAEAAAYIEEETKKAAAHCVKKEPDGRGFLVKEREFIEYPAFLQGQILYHVLSGAAGSKRDIAREHIKQISGLMQKQVGRSICLPYGCTARRVYEGIFIAYEEIDKKQSFIKKNEEDFAFHIFENDFQMVEIPKNQYTKWFDYDKIENGLQIRTRQEGDFFWLDEKGRKKKLKSYFIDEKIPREEREQISLLADGSHILWIVGYRISAYYKVTKKTRRILEVQYHGGKKNE